MHSLLSFLLFFCKEARVYYLLREVQSWAINCSILYILVSTRFYSCEGFSLEYQAREESVDPLQELNPTLVGINPEASGTKKHYFLARCHKVLKKKNLYLKISDNFLCNTASGIQYTCLTITFSMLAKVCKTIIISKYFWWQIY